LKYGTISQRLGNDSMKEFDCCGLCMGKLIDPLCCPKGHLFCKECIYEFLLAQKKEIAKQTELFEEQQRLIQDDKFFKEEEKKQKEIELFDKTVLGIGKVNAPKEPQPKTHIPTGHVPIKTPMGTYYYPDPSAKESAQKQAQLEASVGQQEKGKLPFWIPGNMKEVTPEAMKKPSSEVKCPEGDHTVRVKQLIKVNFAENKTESTKDTSLYQCSLCSRTITNAVKTVLLKKCGHVVCNTCLSSIKKDGVCSVCSEKFKDDHIIPLSNATSYAGSAGEKGVAKIVTPTAWI